MRIFLLCISIGFSSVYANTYHAQTKIDIEVSNVTLEELFNEIQSKSKYIIFYKDGILNPDVKISLQLKNAKLSEVLNSAFSNTNLGYLIDDRQVVITKKNAPEEAGLKLDANSPQNITLKGKVTDEYGSPLPGANVLEKGTTNGAQTDFDGTFTLYVSSDRVTIVASYVGFISQEIPLDGKTNLEIALKENITTLEEVVVVGYGATVKKKDLTGSIASANLDNAVQTTNVSILQALQGAIAGVNINAVTDAGQNPTISVRGRNTLHNNKDNRRETDESSTNQPLIILDGIIYRGNLVDINPSDIKAIDVLKDASSAAIYGSQAANGVLVITTKSGGSSDQKPIINYTSSYSVQSPSNKMRPMRSAEYAEFYPEIFWQEGARIAPDYLQRNPNYDFSANLKSTFLVDGYNAGLDVDWWDQLTRTGSINMHNISIRQKTDNFNYFVSAGITDQKGFLVGDDYTRYNFRVNLESKVTDWLKIGTQTFAVVSDYSGVSPTSRDIFRIQPWAPIKDDEGEFIINPVDGINPFLVLQQDNSDIRLNLSSTLYADIDLPIDGLNYRLNYSNAYRTTNQFNFDPYGGVGQVGTGFKQHNIGWDQTLDNIVSYRKSFNNVHNLNVTLLYGIENRHINSTRAEGSNFDIKVLGYNRLQDGDATLRKIETAKEEESSLYQMARLMYNYKNKYFLTGTVRRDGFSGFGINDKTAVFPTGAVAWVLTEEGFANDSSWLNFLKLRGSYGQSGRRGVERLQTRAKVDSDPSVVFGDGNDPSIGRFISRLASNSLTWETTTGVNFGLDFEMLNSRLSGSVEYYNNKTENILFGIAIPRITGFSGINANIAEVANNGIELTLNGTIVKNKDFQWNTSFNFNRVRNEIVSILGISNDSDNDGKEDDLARNELFIGEPQNVLYNYDIIGMWQIADEADGTLPAGFFPGTYKLRDLNNDGNISSIDDRKIVGYQDPSYRFGIANTITYKDFTFYAFVNSIQGGDDYYLGDDAIHSRREQLSFTNIPSGGFDFWTPENPNAKYRRLDTGSQRGGTRYSSRSFVRLQDVTLSYNIPNKAMNTLGISNAKIFVSGKNLYTWTKWNGWDPETGAGFGAGGVPTMKSYSLGLNVEF
ncbi:SusC/RagA family TonB-linked outer membrane protein [Flavivirga eckloniae]|nr:SusC/RagA family TonB-linked outer membrane protein [Flavivirga eckloniae]